MTGSAGSGAAAERWRAGLEGRRIPEAILAAAPESPYGFPAELFRHRAAASAAGVRGETPTVRRALEALPDGGTVLDVGVGGGATSLPLAARAGLIVGVDGQADMLASFAQTAAEVGTEARTVEGAWPDASDDAPLADVVVCGHVVYNVSDLPPFLRALDAHARRRVVVELTDRHPIAWMADLWQRFHGMAWPDGPSAADAEDVCRDLGFAVRSEVRVETGNRGGGFAERSQAVALVRRRICLGPERDDEIAEALGARLTEHDGLWHAGPQEQTVVTLWWDAER